MKFVSRLALIILIGCGLQETLLRAFQEPVHTRLSNYDKRTSAHQTPSPRPDQVKQRQALARLIPALTVDFDPITGAPRSVRARGFLSGPSGQGKGINPRTLQQFPEKDPHRAVRAFLEDHRRLFGHGPEALDKARLMRSSASARHGLQTSIWQQQSHGIPVFEGLLISHTTRQGELVNISSGFIGDLDSAIRRGQTRPHGPTETPSVSAGKAICIVAESLGMSWTEQALSIRESFAPSAEGWRAFGTPAQASFTATRLVWLPVDDQTARLSWEVILSTTEHGESFRLVVDAQSGQLWLRQSLTQYLSEATYRVFTSDSPSPFSPGHPSPSSMQPPVIERSLVVIDAWNTNASPNGWINDGNNETAGNNVRAQADQNGDNMPDLPRPQGSPFRVFDFPLDLGQPPSASRDASVVQLFYWNNWIHDRLYELGFDEASGNFQMDNFGRGGQGGDPVDADTLDGSGLNNANFSTLPDGMPGRMQMFVFAGPTPPRDGSYDAEVVLHEYVHGLSNRRVGGGIGLSSTQSSGLSEGWSDFYSLSLLSEPGDDLHGNYAFGAYASYRLNGLMENYYYGIRRYPYTTDMSKNPLTFKDIDPTQADPHQGVPRSIGAAGAADQVHRQGEVWASALWDARARLIERYGFSVGNELILQIVTDGMLLTPPNPTFIQARDGILMADEINHGGIHAEDLWHAFARRGLGFSAVAPPSTTTVGVQEAFDVPDDLSIQPTSGFTAIGPIGGPFLPNAATYTLSNSGTNDLAWSILTQASWIQVEPATGTLPAAGEAQPIQISITAEADFLDPGSYAEKITFTNETSQRVQTLEFHLRAGLPDYFTEMFANGDNDLDYTSLTLRPDGSPSHYTACTEPAFAFPSNPEEGIRLTINDDDSRMITLTNGATVEFYGQRTNVFFIGSNGYITFGGGDNNFDGSLASHFAKPRISGLLLDMDPTSGGGIYWQQLSNRVVVTFDDVPMFRSGVRNSFQFELFYDGKIRLTWLDIESPQGVVGLSQGRGVPEFFQESDLTGYDSCTRFLSLSLPDSMSEGAGFVAQIGSVRLSLASDTDLPIHLFSSHPWEASLDMEIIVPAGQTNTTFDMTFPDDTSIDGSQLVHVIASASGYGTTSRSLLILDNETASLSLEIPSEVTEGQPGGIGVLHVNPAVEAMLRVPITSSEPDEISVPSFVVFHPDSNRVSFPFLVVDDRDIDGPRVVQLRADMANWNGAEAEVTVHDNETLELTLTVPPLVNEASGLLAGQGAVILKGLLQTNLTVFLQSSESNTVLLAPSVTIPAGATNGPFDLQIINNDFADGVRSVQLQASLAGWTTGLAMLQVFDDETPPVPQSPQPPNAAEGVETTTLLSWVLEEPGAAAAFPTSFAVFLGTTTDLGPESQVGTTTNTHWTFAARLAPLTTYFWKVVARRTVETEGPVWNFTTKGVNQLVWDSIPLRQRVDTPFPVQLTALDEFSVQVTNFSGIANLSGTGGAEEPASRILISEVDTGTLDAAEFVNVSNREVDASGWEIDFYDNSRWPAPVVRFVLPAGTVVPAGGVFRLMESGTVPGSYPNFFSGTNVSWVPSLSANQIAVLLRDDAGQIADFMCAADAFPGQIQIPQPIPPEQWLGSPLAASDNAGLDYQRIGSEDTDRGQDWTLASPTPGSLPLDLSVPFSGTVRNIDLSPALTEAFVDGTWAGTITVHEPVEDLTLKAQTETGALGLSTPILVLQSNDLTLEISATPTPVVVSSNLLYSLEVYNSGPLAAANVVLSNQLPAQVLLHDMVASQGMCSNLNDTVWCDLGNIEEGASVSINLLTTAAATGILTNKAGIAMKTADATPDNNHRVLLTPSVPVPVLSVSDALVIEGNAGTNFIEFEVSISTAVAHEITVGYSTSNQIALAGIDYLAASGMVTIPPGSVKRPIFIPILGDTIYEGNETFLVQLHDIRGALSGDMESVGTILNDDAAPGFAIEDVQVVEGASGITNANFVIRLTQPSGLPAWVRYATSDNSARAAEFDYDPLQGLLEIPSGTTSATLSVAVRGDMIDEPNETFFLLLSGPTNAFILDNQGVGTIEDDDPLAIISLSSVTLNEGDDDVRAAVFNLVLSPPSGKTVSVSYRTTNQTAMAGSDYAGTNGIVSFAPGITNRPVVVYVYGDQVYEPDETFALILSNPVNAELVQFYTQGNIVNDDEAPGDPVRFVWNQIASSQSARQPFQAMLAGVDVFESLATNFQGSVRIRAFAGGSAVRSILGEPSLMGAKTNNGSITLGYAFTPSTNILVTHFHHVFGERFAIWTDAGELLADQAFSQPVGQWTQTALSVPVALERGRRYRLGIYTGSGAQPSFTRADLGSTFEHGTLDLPIVWFGDQFPVSLSDKGWPLIDLTYLAGSQEELTVAPSDTGNFTNGIWQGSVQINDAGRNVILCAEDEFGHMGFSNPIDVQPVDDLQLSINVSATSVFVGQPLLYSIIASNSGPTMASNVILKIDLPTSVKLVTTSMMTSSLDFSILTLTADIGYLAAGASVLGTLEIEPQQEGTNLVAAGTLTRDGEEWNLENNYARAETSILAPITILAHPESANVMQGATATFSVKAIASEPLQFQWTRDGAVLTNATNTMLVIPNVSPSESGVYSVRLQTAERMTESQPAQLNVNPLPLGSPPGYFDIALPPGYTALANPLTISENTIGQVLFSVPNGTTVIKAGRGGYVINNYLHGWDDPRMSLLPGEGFFLKNPIGTNWTIFFFGQIQEGTLLNQIPQGHSLISSIAPQSGGLITSLAFPATNNITAYAFDGATQGYRVHQYAPNTWNPSEAVLAAGRSLRLRADAPMEWKRQFSTFGSDSGPYHISQPAFKARAGTVNFFTFHSDSSRGRVTNVDGQGVTGPDYVGQLYAGLVPNAATFTPLDQPVPFLAGDSAGYLRAGSIEVPQTVNAQRVYVQLRAWAAEGGTSYESAQALNAPRGKSEIMELTLGAPLSGNNPGQLPPDANQFTNFSLAVDIPNTAPTLSSIADVAIHAGMTLWVTNMAMDAESAPDQLTFSLPSGPNSSVLDPSSGLFHWTPTDADAPSTNQVTVRVTDDGLPPLAGETSFQIVVLPRPAIREVMVMPEGSVQLKWAALPGIAYAVQYKDDLNQTSWMDLPGAVMIEDGFATFTDESSPGWQRFYRIIVLQ